MILNRKSAKTTSRVSLFVAITMLTTIVVLLETNGYQMQALAENGANMCKLGAVDLFITLIW
jgi:hypothetical protein